jgi:hypothetical protein
VGYVGLARSGPAAGLGGVRRQFHGDPACFKRHEFCGYRCDADSTRGA